MADQPIRYPLPTDTAHLRLETRQYELFGVDLGEGIARQSLKIGGVIIAVWVALVAIAGVPLMWWGGPMVYLAPGALASWRALQPDGGGRPSYVMWLDRGRYWRRRGRQLLPPVIEAVPASLGPVDATFVVIDTPLGAA